MKKLLPVLIACMMGIISLAQDLWLSPQRYYFTIRDIATIRFLLGEHFAGKDWIVNNSSIAHLLLYKPSGSTRELEIPANSGNSLQISLSEEGTHMIVCNSSNEHISQDAADFNQYLRHQGLEHVNLLRTRNGEENTKGTMYAQYSIKTIFQVGGKVTDDCLQPSLLPLDIVPEENPYAVQEGTNSEKPVKKRFMVLFNGQPLYNALVRIQYRGANNSISTDSARTNRRGLISVDRHPGANLVTCTYMERNQPDTETQWQSYRASLSFEYSRFFPGKTGR